MQAVGSITLNFQQPNFVTVYAVQNDRLSRRITATLLDGSTAWEPPTGTLMTIRYRKPDGTVGFYDTLENGAAAYAFNGGNTVDFVLAEQALTVPGQVPVELNFYNSEGQKLSTLMFILAVKPSVLSDGEIVSSNYLNVLTAALTQAAQIWQQIQAAYGAPRVAATAAAMTDHSLIYVYTGNESGYTNGNWYYWNGSAWASGGVYNSAAITVDTALSPTSTNPVQNKVIQNSIRSINQGLFIMQEDIDAAEVSALLHAEEIAGTTQTITFDAAGNVTQITHMGATAAVRTDVFTFGTEIITEVRTLNTGDRLTIVTNTTTLATTVTYTPAA